MSDDECTTPDTSTVYAAGYLDRQQALEAVGLAEIAGKRGESARRDGCSFGATPHGDLPTDMIRLAQARGAWPWTCGGNHVRLDRSWNRRL